MAALMRFCIARTLAILRHMGVATSLFGATTENGNPVPYRQRVITDEALVTALEDQGLTNDWDGDPAQRVRVGAAQEVAA